MLSQEQVIKIIFQVKQLFKSFFGAEYDQLIEERISSVQDIVFYRANRKAINRKSDLDKFLDYYKIERQKAEINQKKIPFYRDLIIHSGAGMCPYLENGEIKKIIYIPLNPLTSFSVDHLIVHELAHALFEVLKTKDNEQYFQGGLDSVQVNLSNPSQRNFESLNEYIHDKLTNEMVLFLHNELNITLVSRENTLVEEKIEPLERFYELFRDDIIKHFLLGTTEVLIEKIGLEELREFNNWYLLFNEEYPDKQERIKYQSLGLSDYLNLIYLGNIIVNKIDNRLKNVW